MRFLTSNDEFLKARAGSVQRRPPMLTAETLNSNLDVWPSV